MSVKARCPGCGRQVSAPDKAVGRKAKCPDCGQVVEFRAEPSGGGDDRAKAALAFLEHEGSGARPKGGAALEALKAPASAAPAAESEAAVAAGPSLAASAVATPTPGAAASPTPATSTTKSVTTIERMAARTSRYGTQRLVAAIYLAIGMVLAILIFVGGLASLIIVAMQGHPLLGVLCFVGGLVVAAVTFLTVKLLSDMLRVTTDVGDEARRILHMLEDHLNHRRE